MMENRVICNAAEQQNADNRISLIPIRPYEEKRPAITRERYVELTALAKRAAEELEQRGLKKHEYCQFGEIVQRMLAM